MESRGISVVSISSASEAGDDDDSSAESSSSHRPEDARADDTIRNMQQRLFLLRHACKCRHDEGCCPVTPHCATMKRLWDHILECRNARCAENHCVSSRYVLSHYHSCDNSRCIVCEPIRMAIREAAIRKEKIVG